MPNMNMNMSLSCLRVNNDDDFDEKFDKNVTVNVPPALYYKHLILTLVTH